MYDMISLASTKNFYGGNPRVFKDEIKRENLLVASSPMEGDL
jgi:DNA polymerase III alpha subunit (gram-positive type)